MTSESEKVYAVFDYWDQPIEGVAKYQNIPHYYKRLFDEGIDDWSHEFLLFPLAPVADATILELDSIRLDDATNPQTPEAIKHKSLLALLYEHVKKDHYVAESPKQVFGVFHRTKITHPLAIYEPQLWVVTWNE